MGSNLNGVRKFGVFGVEQVGARERVDDDEAGLEVEEGVEVGVVELVELGGKTG